MRPRAEEREPALEAAQLELSSLGQELTRCKSVIVTPGGSAADPREQQHVKTLQDARQLQLLLQQEEERARLQHKAEAEAIRTCASCRVTRRPWASTGASCGRAWNRPRRDLYRGGRAEQGLGGEAERDKADAQRTADSLRAGTVDQE